MKPLVNLGLLCFFVTLLASGLMRFFQPFSLAVTRVHIAFGLGTAVLVGFHLSSRGKYFLNLLRASRPGSRGRVGTQRQVVCAVGLWAATLAAAIWDRWPVTQLIGYSYEAQHAREIFRPHARVAYQPVESGLRLHRGESSDTGLRIEFEWGEAAAEQTEALDLSGVQTQLAIWVENEEGEVVETLYVSESCAHSSALNWGGVRLRREDILPVWANRYGRGIEATMNDDLDGISSPTPVRDFSMDGHLGTDALPFALYVEVNAPCDVVEPPSLPQTQPGDGAEALALGQPSVVYEARIYPDDDRTYYLMDLIGHGSVSSSDVNYDLSNVTTAKKLVDKILVAVSWPDAVEQTRPASQGS